MKIKKIILLLLIMLMLVSSSFAGENLTVKIVDIELNGKSVPANGPKPFIIEGTTMVPTRWVSENLGKEIQWDGSNNTVLIDSEKEMWNKKLKIENQTWRGYQRINLVVDNGVVGMGNSLPGFIIEGFSFVPLRPLSNSLGIDIIWNGELNKVTLSSKTAVKEEPPNLLIKSKGNREIKVRNLFEEGENYLDNYSGVTKIIPISNPNNYENLPYRKFGLDNIDITFGYDDRGEYILIEDFKDLIMINESSGNSIDYLLEELAISTEIIYGPNGYTTGVTYFFNEDKEENYILVSGDNKGIVYSLKWYKNK